MKKIMLTLVAALFFGSLAHADCSQSAAIAAFSTAQPNGNNLKSPLYVSVGNSTLLAKQISILTYEVRIDFDINDGASSDSFPSEVYRVSAKGSERSCKIIAVQLKN